MSPETIQFLTVLGAILAAFVFLFREMKEGRKELSERIDKVEIKLSERIDKVDERIDKVYERIEKLENTMAGLNTRMAVMESKMSDIGTNLAYLMWHNQTPPIKQPQEGQ